jgi:hypothetical protein
MIEGMLVAADPEGMPSRSKSDNEKEVEFQERLDVLDKLVDKALHVNVARNKIIIERNGLRSRPDEDPDEF